MPSDVSETKLVFGVPPERPTPNFPPSWNATPTDQLPIVRFDAQGWRAKPALGALGLREDMPAREVVRPPAAIGTDAGGRKF